MCVCFCRCPPVDHAMSMHVTHESDSSLLPPTIREFKIERQSRTFHPYSNSRTCQQRFAPTSKTRKTHRANLLPPREENQDSPLALVGVDVLHEVHDDVQGHLALVVHGQRLQSALGVTPHGEFRRQFHHLRKCHAKGSKGGHFSADWGLIILDSVYNKNGQYNTGVVSQGRNDNTGPAQRSTGLYSRVNLVTR